MSLVLHVVSWWCRSHFCCSFWANYSVLKSLFVLYSISIHLYLTQTLSLSLFRFHCFNGALPYINMRAAFAGIVKAPVERYMDRVGRYMDREL